MPFRLSEMCRGCYTDTDYYYYFYYYCRLSGCTDSFFKPDAAKRGRAHSATSKKKRMTKIKNEVISKLIPMLFRTH